MDTDNFGPSELKYNKTYIEKMANEKGVKLHFMKDNTKDKIIEDIVETAMRLNINLFESYDNSKCKYSEDFKDLEDNCIYGNILLKFFDYLDSELQNESEDEKTEEDKNESEDEKTEEDKNEFENILKEINKISDSNSKKRKEITSMIKNQ